METEKETDRVENIVAAIAVPSLDVRAKARLKERIFMRLDYPIVDSLREVASNTRLEPYSVARIKEAVFATIMRKKQKWFFWENFFAWQKKVLAGVTACVMIFSVFSFFSFNSSIARAESFTVLISHKGYVSVLRDGKVLPLTSDLKLIEKDHVVTGNDGYASIKFFDDSVSRLSNDTVIVLSKLQKVDNSKVKSYVEVSLKEGRLWSRVLNLVQSHSSFTVQANDLYVTAKKAAFDVKVDNKKTDVQVFNHTVDISGADVGNTMSGQKVVVGSDKKVSVGFLSNNDKSDDWITKNLTDDKKYVADTEERLLAAKIQSVGGKVDNVSFEKSLQENAMLFLTFDDVKQKKIELDLAEKNFIAAQVVLSSATAGDDEKKKAGDAINDFSTKVKGFYILAKNVSLTDVKYGDELNKYVEDKILVQKKDLDFVLPGSPLYSAKNTLDDLESSGNLKPEDLVAVKMDNALGKLSDAQEVISKGNGDNVDVALDGYKSDINQAINVIQDMPADDLKAKSELAEKIVNDIDLAKNVTPADPGMIELKTAALDVQTVAKEEEKDIEKGNEGVAKGDEVAKGEKKEEVGSADVADSVGVVGAIATSAVPEVQTETQKNSDEYGIKMEGGKVLPPLMGK